MAQLSFELIYEMYFERVYKYLLKLSGNQHIAEDITSETFIKAMANAKSFQGKSDISTWLISIAKNCYISYLRKNDKNVDLESLPIYFLSHEDDTDFRLIDREDVNNIYSILHSLKDPYKEVFMLRVLGQVSFKEIGEIFGRTDNWACVTYHRARMMIRENPKWNYRIIYTDIYNIIDDQPY